MKKAGEVRTLAEVPFSRLILELSALSFSLVFVANLVGGVTAIDCLRLSVVVTTQLWVGLLLWSLALPRSSSRIEILGLSLCLGTLCVTLLSTLITTRAPSGILWVLPGLMSLVLLLVVRRNQEIQRTSLSSGGFIVVLVSLGLFVQAYFWRENPLRWTGWWQHYSDIYFHEGIAKSITENGLDSLNWLQGYGIGYHWFADAWIGDMSAVSQVGHFVVASRLIFTVAIISCTCLTWSWARRISSRPLAPIFASALVLIAGSTGAALRNTYSVVGALYSPTHTFALMSLLALSFVVMHARRGSLSVPYLAVVALLGIGAGGGRITQVVVMLGATIGLLLQLLINRRFTRIWAAKLFAMWLGILIGLMMAIRPWATIIRNNKFLLEPNTQFGAMLGFVPDSSTLGNLVSVVAVLFSVGAGWAGLLWYSRSRPIPDSIAWILGGTVAGFLAVFLTYQNGFSHMTFLWSASALALVGSGVGVAEVIHTAREGTSPKVFKRAVGAAILLGLVSGGMGVWISFETPGLRFEGLIRWSIPILIWIIAAAIGVSFAVGLRIPLRSPLIWAVTIIVLTSAAVSAGLTAATMKLLQPIPSYSSSTPLALTQSQLDAADWVNANVPDSGLFVTNRFCMDPTQSPPTCKSNWFLVSALAGRRTLVEGYSDGTGLDISTETPENSWLRDRVLPIIDFSNSPTSSTQKDLWNRDVRWVWIDRTITKRDSWEPFATTIFENETTKILKLNPPKN